MGEVQTQGEKNEILVEVELSNVSARFCRFDLGYTMLCCTVVVCMRTVNFILQSLMLVYDCSKCLCLEVWFVVEADIYTSLCAC